MVGTSVSISMAVLRQFVHRVVHSSLQSSCLGGRIEGGSGELVLVLLLGWDMDFLFGWGPVA